MGIKVSKNKDEIINYLTKEKGLDLDLIKAHIKNKYIYQLEGNTCAFIIKNKSDSPIGMESSGKITEGQGYGFNIIRCKNPKYAFYFKDSVELFSFIQKIGYDEYSKRLKDSVWVSMSGYNLDIIENMQGVYGAKQIYLCLDDKKSIENFTKEVEKKFSFKLLLPKASKEWNDLVKEKRSINELLDSIKYDKKEYTDKINVPFDEIFYREYRSRLDKYKNISGPLSEKGISKDVIKFFSDKTVTYEYGNSILNTKSDTLIISDSVLNGLSLVTIMNDKKKDINSYSYIMLNRAENTQKALKSYINEHKNVKNVVFAFSNNEKNKNMIESLSNELNINTIKYFPKLSTFNEELRLKEAKRDVNRGYKRYDGRAQSRNGENRDGNSRVRETITTDERVFKGSNELSKGDELNQIQRTPIETRVDRKIGNEEPRSRGNDVANNREAGREGESGGNSGYISENEETKINLSGSEKPGNERDSTKTSLNNFRQLDKPIYGGAKEKYKNNIAAIELLKDIEKQERFATQSEQEILAMYTGWGGIPQAFDSENKNWEREYIHLNNLLTKKEYELARASTPNAHYTDPVVIDAVYNYLESAGFKNGKVLEPSMGVGNFFARKPESISADLYGIELDDISGRISKQLYQNANIQINGFEKANVPDEFFDVAIGNIPFGNYQVYDPKYNDKKFLIHDYFFAKTLDKIKPGGIIAYVTTKGTLDKSNNNVRKYIAERAELLGAVRLPNTAFKSIANTEVTTDIIFLQKREKPIVCEPEWIHISATDDGVPVNQYFIDNPDMLLGKMVYDKSMYGNEKSTSLIAESDFNLENSLNNVIKNIKKFSALEQQENKGIEEKKNYLVADPNVKNFSYTVIDDDLYYRKNEFMYKSPLKGVKLNKAKALHEIRNSVREVIDIQLLNSYDEALLKDKQSNLNKLYDNFVQEYGYINSRANKSIFNEDDDVFLLRNIEIRVDEDTYEKADIFSKATINPRTEIEISTAQDALVISLNNRGKVDIDYMSSVYGKSTENIVSELGNLIFLNPLTNAYETRDQYLSGNVKEKLVIAKEAGEKFLENVKELELVQPEDIKIYDIGFKLGSNWINTNIYNEFIYELLNTPNYYKFEGHNNYIGLTYNEYTAEYKLNGKSIDKDNVLVDFKYGTKRINAYEIIEDTLNQKIVDVFDYYKVYEDGKEKTRKKLNLKETQLARAKQEIIKNEFRNWILKNKSNEIENFYNKNLNVYVPRRFSGEIILPAMNTEIELRDHQKETAMRILLGGNTLIAHEVGAGKTFTLAAGAMLLKQAGIAEKPLFVVPNHLLKQWGNEFVTLFPNANILVPSEQDFTKANRKKFVAKIAFGSYDAVFLTFSQFEKIGMSQEFLENQIKKDIEEIANAINEIRMDSDQDRLSIKSYETLKKQLETKLEKMVAANKKDKMLTFEELGVDYLFVDEAHNYKNCFVHTKMRNVAGISNSNADKSYDMLMKTKYLTEKTNGRGVVFATGTPVTNSISELFVMQRYLQEDALKKIGIRHFDQWASYFGDITSSIELDPTGTKYVIRTRFSKFHNMPELLKLLNQVSDFKTADELNLARPDIVGGKAANIVMKPSEFAKEKMQEFSERADRIKSGNVDSTIDNMLMITNEGRKLAIDPRLIDPTYTKKDSKLFNCVDNVVELHKEFSSDKALQLVFLDYGVELYKLLKDEMIQKGIKKDEIAFIGDAKTKEQKEILFGKCRSGQIRVLIGSTSKMGAGTNVQKRMVALHHVDCPWRPSDLEQRNGRICRQGNMYDKVHIVQYVSESTFDAYLWQLQEKKQTFISQLMKNDFTTREYGDVDGRSLEYSEVKALCLGNPKLKEKADIDNDVQKLQLEKSMHFKEQRSLNELILNLPQRIKKIENSIEALNKDVAIMSNSNSKFEIIIGNTKFDKHQDAGKKLNSIINEMPSGEKVIGNYKSFDIVVSKSFHGEINFSLNANYDMKNDLGEDPVGNIKRIENIEKRFNDRLNDLENKKSNFENQLEEAKKEYGKPFSKENELSDKLQRQVALAFELENQERSEKSKGERVL